VRFTVQAVGMKKLSILLGTAGQLALSAGYWGYISAKVLCVYLIFPHPLSSGAHTLTPSPPPTRSYVGDPVVASAPVHSCCLLLLLDDGFTCVLGR
jgi:hypothetical protein